MGQASVNFFKLGLLRSQLALQLKTSLYNLKTKNKIKFMGLEVLRKGNRARKDLTKKQSIAFVNMNDYYLEGVGKSNRTTGT